MATVGVKGLILPFFAGSRYLSSAVHGIGRRNILVSQCVFRRPCVSHTYKSPK